MGVVISASGSHVTKAVTVAELLKRRLQVSKLYYDIIVTSLQLKTPNTVNNRIVVLWKERVFCNHGLVFHPQSCLNMSSAVLLATGFVSIAVKHVHTGAPPGHTDQVHKVMCIIRLAWRLCTSLVDSLLLISGLRMCGSQIWRDWIRE